MDFTVCHDLFLTPTARFCDVVLPITSFLEREDVVFPNGNFLLYSSQVSSPVGQSRNDYDILSELAAKLGFGGTFTDGKSSDDWLNTLLAESEIKNIEEFKSTGIFVGKQRGRNAFTAFIENPQKSRLATPSGLIELSSAEYGATGYPEYPVFRGFSPSREFPLRLITPHGRYLVNSQNTNDSWTAARQSWKLTINTHDAATRGIEDGDPVHVFNDKGRVETAAEVTEDIMEGVVCLPAGGWSDLGEDGIERGGCANALTSTEPTQPSQGPRTHSVAVEVRLLMPERQSRRYSSLPSTPLSPAI